MEKRNVLNSPRIQKLNKKKNKVVVIKAVIFIVLFLLVIVGFGFLSRLPSLNIQKVSVSGNSIVDGDQIEEKVNQEIAGHYLWFFPKTNFFFYPKEKIKESLSDEFARLKDITIAVKAANVLEVSVTERQASYTWCGETLPTHKIGEGDCYFLDDAGYILDEAPYFSNDVYFRFFGKLHEKNDKVLGAMYLPGIFKNVAAFKNELTQMALNPSSLYVKDDGDAEVYLLSSVPPPDAQKIVFKINSNLETVAENLQTALDTEPFKTDFKKKYATFSYLDLRFGNKVYFKFK